MNLSAKRGKYYPISPAHAQFMRKGTPLKKSSLFTVLVLLLSLLLVSYTLNGFYIHDHTLHAILWEEMLFELELISSLFTIFLNKTPSKLPHIPQWLTKHTHTHALDEQSSGSRKQFSARRERLIFYLLLFVSRPKTTRKSNFCI